MKMILMKCMIVICALTSTVSASSTWYVSLNSATNGPGTGWGNAFHVIQDAVDSATNGDTVVVDSGVYNTGTNKTPGHSSRNCVVITNDITVQSVNGAAATIIDAYGFYTRRGVYMSAGTLKGFSVINGKTSSYNDDYYDKSGGGVNMYGGTGKIIDCVVSNNSCRKFGGGVYYGSMERCVVADNYAGESGGGASFVNASSCAIYGNWANLWGGGSYRGVLVNSTISGNGSAFGGGVSYTTATNSIIWNNDALHNENWEKGSLAYCCTYPVPPGIGNFDADPLLLDGKHIYISSPCTGVGDAATVPSADIDNEAWSAAPAVGCDQPASSIFDDITAYISCKYHKAVVGKKIDFRANITGTPESIYWTFDDTTVETNKYNISHSWSNPGDYSVHLHVFNDNYPTGKEVNCTVSIKDLSDARYYVDVNSASASYPYTSWTTAASNIQDAVHVAENSGIAGAEVVVTDGVYQVGEEYVSGKYIYSQSSNRVVISKDIVVRSVNGRDYTFIKGKPAGTYNGFGDDAVRCVYMSAGHLEGFTLTNGYTRASGDPDFEQSGGGANLYGGLATISDCIFVTNAANNNGGGLYYGKVDNSIFSNNSAWGAGAIRAVVSNCLFVGNDSGGLSFGYAYDSTFISNRNVWGGAAYRSDLYNCNLSGNRAEGTTAAGGGISYCNFYGGIISNNLSEKNGGGAENSTIYGAIICNNYSYKNGGGVYVSTVSNSVICDNIAEDNAGGGADGSILYNCLVVSNKALGFIPGPPETNLGNGGGANNSYLYNCTVANNYANYEAGGVDNCKLTNSIVWDNIAENTNDNYSSGSFDYCCTTPNPSSGNNNIEMNPLFMNPAERDYHLRVYSPCVDSGADLAGIIDDDLDDEARPIDGDVDGSPAWDMGCYEYDAYKSDSDNDGMSDGWEYLNGLDPTNELDATIDSDSDNVVNIDEYVADTSPTNDADFFKITAITNDSSVTVYFKSSSRRAYVLQGCSNLNNNVWLDISGGKTRTGVDGSDSMTDDSPSSRIETYRVMVEIP